MGTDSREALRARIAALEAALEAAERRHRSGDPPDVGGGTGAAAALPSGAGAGRTDLQESEAALASSRAETKAGQADLLASVVALSSLRAESEAVNLASEAALASSRAETKLTLDDLVASAVALALAQEETRAGQNDLLASEVANKALALANGLLVTSEAALESLVDKRTRALLREMAERRLAQESLRQGEKLQAIGHLTGGIAHDFNNILHVIFSGTSLLRRSGLTEERRSTLLDSIEHAASRASDLTGRLLAFARRQVLQPRAFDLNLRLADMSVLLQPALGSHIKIETDFAPDLWPIIADPSQLEVAVLNLAVNARDAMMPEGGVFTIRTGNATLAKTLEREAGDYVCLTVSDSGPGMSPDVMSHAFEPFYTTKAPGKGTGLGLAQVYGFAKQSGGDVSIESAQGNGTAIVLHFMRPTEAAIAAAAPRTDDAHAPRVARQAAGHTILVVDDDMDLAGLTASMLEDTGYTVMRAANADDALAVLSAGDKVDAVFSDVIMPGTMNGVDLAVTLRVRYPHVAVLLATGYSQLLAEWNGPTEVEVLKKPYRLNDLVAALDRSFSAVTPGHTAC